MATSKLYSVVGTSRQNGEVKVRFANDFVSRFKALVRNGHTDIELIELGDKYTKAECLKVMMEHERFQSEEQQSAIYEFVVRNVADFEQKEFA